MNTWPKRRSAFSHDWLKNQYMSALAKFLNLLDDMIEDPEFERAFLPFILPQWESHSSEVAAVIKDFESCMSPQALFLSLPLSDCDDQTRRWLGDLVHSLWLTRDSIVEKVSAASIAAGDVEEAYSTLQHNLRDFTATAPAEDLRPLRDYFATFRERCQLLAAALEQLPNRIGVI